MQIGGAWRRFVQASCFTCAVVRTFSCFGLVVVSAWLPAPPHRCRRRLSWARALDQAGDEQDCMSAVNEAKCRIGVQ
jgi:hypothetical protein